MKLSRVNFAKACGRALSLHHGIGAIAMPAPSFWAVYLFPQGHTPSCPPPVSSAGAPTSECIIKGNVNIHGERVYHTPGQNAYSKINMQDPRKRWFCSEEDARIAGWRPAKH